MRGMVSISGENIDPAQVRKLAQAGHTRKAVREALAAGCSEYMFRKYLKKAGLNGCFLARKDWLPQYHGNGGRQQKYSDAELIALVQDSPTTDYLYEIHGVGVALLYHRWPHLGGWANIKAWCDKQAVAT